MAYASVLKSKVNKKKQKDMIITRKEYLNALETVEKYNIQNADLEEKWNGVMLLDFLRENNVSIRLLNGITRMVEDDLDHSLDRKLTVKFFIDNYSIEDICQARNIGKTTLIELFELFSIHEISL